MHCYFPWYQIENEKRWKREREKNGEKIMKNAKENIAIYASFHFQFHSLCRYVLNEISISAASSSSS
jgi:hypothetical protein